jgi:hypothetical protein
MVAEIAIEARFPVTVTVLKTLAARGGGFGLSPMSEMVSQNIGTAVKTMRVNR